MMRIAEHIREQDDTNDAAPDASTRSVDQWLGAFKTFLRLPPSEKDAITAELESHLNERVRDLIIDGHSEEQAIRRATEELGETAQLAARFRSAHRYPKRKLAMNITLISLTAAVVGAGAWSLAPGTSTANPSVFNTTQDERIEKIEHRLSTQEIAVQFNDAPISDVISYLAITADLNILIHEAALEDYGISLNDITLTFQSPNIDVRELINIVERRVQMEESSLAFDIQPKYIELNFSDDINRRNIRAVSYDVGPVIDSLFAHYDLDYDSAVDRMTELITGMVAPDNWTDNGGELASMWIVGGKLFVQAPSAMHEKVNWIITELNHDQEFGSGVPATEEMHFGPASGGGGSAGVAAPRPGSRGGQFNGAGAPGGGSGRSGAPGAGGAGGGAGGGALGGRSGPASGGTSGGGSSQ